MLKKNKLKNSYLAAILCINGLAYSSPIITWQQCSSDFPQGFLCGMLTVPMDYKNLSASNIQLPVTIHPHQGAADQYKGILVMNHGGPWSDEAASQPYDIPDLSTDIKNQFDIVSFSPRGTANNPFVCHSSDMNKIYDLDKILILKNLTLKNVNSIYDAAKLKNQLCQYDSISEYASTKNTVQDLEQLRQALVANGGFLAQKINYYGASYGTRLGLAYLITYPKNVNRMVLDANVAPDNSFLNFIETSSKGSENVLHAFFNDCIQAGTACPLYISGFQTTEQLEAAYKKLFSEAAQSGIPTSAKYYNRPFNSAMFTLLLSIVFANNGYWIDFSTALNQAFVSNNADLLMQLFTNFIPYNPETDTFNPIDLFDDGVSNIMCEDFLPLPKKPLFFYNLYQWQNQSPLIGGNMGFQGAWKCIGWHGNNDPLIPALKDIKPIPDPKPNVLIVSNTYDYVVPPQSAQKESEFLTKLGIPNQILTWNGPGHIAYHQNSPEGGCIDQNVDQFLLTGQYPTVSICNDGTNPFLQNNGIKPIMKKKHYFMW